MLTIDLNCDLGEGIGNESQLMPYISSANIACGFHAGDYAVMDATVKLAIKHNVAIGAHPSFPDKENFGRLEMLFAQREIYQMMLYQLGALSALVKANNVKMHHVKPHGALYNIGARNPVVAEAIADGIKDFDSSLIIYGLANSELIKAAANKGLRYQHEVFADRTYQNDGSLTPRSSFDALIKDELQAIKQINQMITKHSVTSVSGESISIQPDTVCIHGDGNNAASLLKAIHTALTNDGIIIKAA